jgi:phage shock protein PspC (stress-responsive transcriptional regulator)
LGGVAAGLANYFKIDPTVVRLLFILATFLTSGGFIFVYLVMWLLIPAPGSTAADPGKVVQENLNEIGTRFRSMAGDITQSTGSSIGNSPTGNWPDQGQSAPYNQGQVQPPAGTSAAARPSIGPIVLILVGAFFLLSNLGLFRLIHWGAWWPLLLIGLGLLLLVRNNRA